MTEIAGSDVDSARWDSFAKLCGASMRSAYSHARAWSLKHLFRARLRLFEVHLDGDDGRRKIGQCAIGQSRHELIFLDRLQLLSNDSAIWRAAMVAILRAAGPGEYTYGWTHNLEQPRESDLRRISGVTISTVRPITVEAVDFSRWSSWDEYWRATSNNIRRNVKKAQVEIVDLALESRRGVRSLAQIPAVVRLRVATYHRKGLNFRPLREIASTAGTVLSCPECAFTVLASGRGKVLAAFSGFQFGANTYYLDGGSTSDNAGASWYLMMHMLREAYDRAPQGRFVMGYIDHAIHDEAVGGGLVRSRQSCRVTDYETSIVRFRWSAAGV